MHAWNPRLLPPPPRSGWRRSATLSGRSTVMCRYWKCVRSWMHGPGTDWVARSPTCVPRMPHRRRLGVGLQDGCAVVIKAHRTPVDVDAAQATIDAQRTLAGRNLRLGSSSPTPKPSSPASQHRAMPQAQPAVAGYRPRKRSPPSSRTTRRSGLTRYRSVNGARPPLRPPGFWPSTPAGRPL